MYKFSYTTFSDPFTYEIRTFFNSSTLIPFDFTVAHYITDSKVSFNLIIVTI